MSNTHMLAADLARDTGWRRRIGCLKFQVIFRKRATNYVVLGAGRTSRYYFITNI